MNTGFVQPSKPNFKPLFEPPEQNSPNFKPDPVEKWAEPKYNKTKLRILPNPGLSTKTILKPLQLTPMKKGLIQH